MRLLRVAAVVAALAAAGAGCAAAQPEATPLRVGQTLQGALVQGDSQTWGRGRMRVYRFQARAGVRYQVSVRPLNEVLGPELTLSRMVQGVTDHLWRTHEGGPGRNDVRKAFTATADETLLLIVNANNGYDVGRFSISLDTLGTRRPGAEPLTIGHAVSGTLTAGDRRASLPGLVRDLYFFEAREGRRLRVTVTAPDSAPGVSLGRLGADGDFVTLAIVPPANGQMNYTLPATGDHYVQVLGDPTQRGGYTLRVDDRPLAPPPRTLPVQRGQTVAGVLEEGDLSLSAAALYDAFSYRGRAGERLRIELASAEFEPAVLIGRMVDGLFEELDSAAGAYSNNAMRSLLEIVLPADGEYVIRAATLHGRGDYRLILAP